MGGGGELAGDRGLGFHQRNRAELRRRGLRRWWRSSRRIHWTTDEVREEGGILLLCLATEQRTEDIGVAGWQKH